MKAENKYVWWLVIASIVITICVLVSKTYAQPQTCVQKPEIPVWFPHDPNELVLPVHAAVIVDSAMQKMTHRFATVRDCEGHDVWIEIVGDNDTLFDVTIGTVETMTGGTVDNVVSLSTTAPLPAGKYYIPIRVYDTLGARYEFMAVVWSVDNRPPVFGPVPNGISSCDGCYDGG